ncbi:TPA: PHP domain-containing protein [Clostridium botulinum]|nr:PHP domain-containing protein [Clostridium botulinum]
MGKKYYNYHKHDHKGNVRSLDVITKLEDYCKRAIELKHDAVFTTNHGMQGDIFEAISLSEKYNLKMIVGCECYYVKNRLEKDRSNKHIVIIALNNKGVLQLNEIISQSNMDGYYYKPRIDDELLFSLNQNNFVITTACVAGILEDKELVLKLHKKFNDNFFVEIQNHNEKLQKEFNILASKYKKEYGIKLIHANDSHYIYPEDSKYRNLFLNAKGIKYEEETDFILDYPDYDTIVERYKKQGILNEEDILEAINNTLIFEKAENITLINTDIKLPSISKDCNKELKEMIAKSWCKEYENIHKNKISEYEEAIQYEMNIVEKTHMEDYFILDKKIVELAEKKYEGRLTNTGRGSAPSFYINKLLGLTDIDRLDAPVPLFPTRFMSVERILGAKSLPDIDLNTADREPFIQATKDLLGEENCAWMIAWKPLQKSSAFRLYCKSLGMHISEYDEIAKNLDKYIGDDKWGKIIEDSKPFIGVIESISESPCSMLLYDKNVAQHIGLIKIKNKITGIEKMCCLLDGYNCDKFKYLKNDYLSVTVWSIIKQVCELANINIPTIKELNALLDEKTYAIYKKGLTCTINQVDSDWATHLAKDYKMGSVAEASAFVASIRPGFASLLDNFIKRKPYTTGVNDLDEILKDSYHYLLYQESIMKYLIWLGISENVTYDIIKKIAKKKFKEAELEELKNNLKKGWINQVGSENGFEVTWQVVEDASHYSFNASHSLSYAYDSLYGAYLKSHYPLEYYSIVLNEYSGDSDRTNKLTNELEYFNIKIKPPKFRYSSGKYMPNKETNTIYKGIGSIKYCNEKIGEELYNLRQNKYDSFLEAMKDVLYKTSIDMRQLEILIKLNFFSEFGKTKRILDTFNIFTNIYNKKQFNKNKLPSPLTENLVRKYSNKETEKLFKDIDMFSLMKELIDALPNEDISIQEIFETELEYVGYISYIDKSYNDNTVLVSGIEKNRYGTPFTTLYKLNDGTSATLKVDKKYFYEKPLSQYDMIYINDIKEKSKRRKVDGKWVVLDEKEFILNNYSMVVN